MDAVKTRCSRTKKNTMLAEVGEPPVASSPLCGEIERPVREFDLKYLGAPHPAAFTRCDPAANAVRDRGRGELED
jgi:hypothetical protein